MPTPPSNEDIYLYGLLELNSGDSERAEQCANRNCQTQDGPAQNKEISTQRADPANGRPVTRKSGGQAIGKAASPTNGSLTGKQPL